MSVLLLVACLGIGGCATVTQKATYDPTVGADGNAVVIKDAKGNIIGVAASKSVTQVVRVTAGAKVDEALFNFNAKAQSPDGSGWEVQSGMNPKGVQSPDTLKDVTELIKTLAPALAAASAAQSIGAGISDASSLVNILQNLPPGTLEGLMGTGKLNTGTLLQSLTPVK